VENVVEGMEFVPATWEAYEKSLAETGTPNDGEAYPPVVPIELLADTPAKYLTVDEVRAMEDLQPPAPEPLVFIVDPPYFTLTAADLKKAYDDAVALWKPGHLRAKQTGYLLYNSLDLPIELSAHVLQYLFDRAAELAPPEAK
jgi:hypothetical protein